MAIRGVDWTIDCTRLAVQVTWDFYCLSVPLFGFHSNHLNGALIWKPRIPYRSVLIWKQFILFFVKFFSLGFHSNHLKGLNFKVTTFLPKEKEPFKYFLGEHYDILCVQQLLKLLYWLWHSWQGSCFQHKTYVWIQSCLGKQFYGTFLLILIRQKRRERSHWRVRKVRISKRASKGHIS